MKFQYIAASAALFSMIFASCGESKFKIDGEVYGAEGKSLVLEKSDFHGRWIAVDSTKVDGSGQFSIKADAPASPDIYRLSLGDDFIYLPVDSVETLTVTTSASDFGRKFTITGTEQAELLASFEKELQAFSATDPAAVDNFKRSVFTKYIKDGQGSILSYYILTKIVDGKPLYDPENAGDAKYYAAVATQFDNFRPGDPHGQMVKAVSLEAMRKRNSEKGKKRVVEANEIKVLDIALPDISGKIVKLSDVVGKGKPVVVVFSMMNEKESPAFNRELARIYNAKGGSFQIYQVSFDAGQYEWREAARNLPWINVNDPAGTASTSLVDYNVGSMPAVFLYNSAGELTERPETLSALESKL